MKRYQCIICKTIKSFNHITEKKNIKLPNKQNIIKDIVKPEKLKEIVCCNRRMREITEKQYKLESELNQKGYRDTSKHNIDLSKQQQILFNLIEQHKGNNHA